MEAALHKERMKMKLKEDTEAEEAEECQSSQQTTLRDREAWNRHSHRAQKE